MARRRRRAESRARYYIREEARKRGWNIDHVDMGGDCLEEQEATAYFLDLGLGQNRPDFLFCLTGEPTIVIEAKNEANKIEEAIGDAINYANTINATGRYNIKIAVGAAGEQTTGFTVVVKYLTNGEWVSLKSHGFELTTIPSKREVELALDADDATTSVTVPSSVEFIDAAIELSIILRAAKVEAPLRPKVIGAIVLAMYQGEIDSNPENVLESINNLAETAINSTPDLPENKKEQLFDALKLSGADFNRLSPYIRRIISLLRRLNIRSILHTDTDFLGMFYEAFLRYGYDNNALGIVFTPRHITRFCVDLLGVAPNDKVIDIASGTGGFLVAAFDSMMRQSEGPAAIELIKSSLYGFDTNPTIWALSTLNMFFRGDGKSHIEQGNCFDNANREAVRRRFTRAFLNPPFSQEDEPERDFIDASLEALEPGGTLAVVVKAGIFADGEHKNWRKQLVRRHTLLGVISLPEDLFYPNAAVPTSILLAKAHIPQRDDQNVFMARVWNDGFEKLKNRRVERDNSQLPEIKECFHAFLNGEYERSEIVTIIRGERIKDGEEWSPQEWLPQPHLSEQEIAIYENEVLNSIYQTIVIFPDLSDEVNENLTDLWERLPEYPLNYSAPISFFFNVENGKSTGEKNYNDGTRPYISSGDLTNSIVRTVVEEEEESFSGGITVTAFGKAHVQPWSFLARGNGGSSVRVLLPKFKMSFRELVWFASQINAQQWRFFYARMAIKSRISRLVIKSPPTRLPDEFSIAERIREFKSTLDRLSNL